MANGFSIKSAVLFYVAFFWMAIFSANSQDIDTASINTEKVFTSLEDALKIPGAVYRLILEKENLKEIPVEIYSFVNTRV